MLFDRIRTTLRPHPAPKGIGAFPDPRHAEATTSTRNQITLASQRAPARLIPGRWRSPRVLMPLVYVTARQRRPRTRDCASSSWSPPGASCAPFHIAHHHKKFALPGDSLPGGPSGQAALSLTGAKHHHGYADSRRGAHGRPARDRSPAPLPQAFPLAASGLMGWRALPHRIGAIEPASSPHS
jgi:hypothetical protein